MEIMAISLGIVGVSAVLAWWDNGRRSAATDELRARVTKLEEHALDARNNIAGLKSFANIRKAGR